MLEDDATSNADRNDGAAVLMVIMEVEPDAEAEFNRWYNDRHVQQRLEMPGFVSARRFRSTERAGRYLAIYDLETPDAALSDDYMSRARALEDDWDRQVSSRWDLKVREVWVDVSPTSWSAPE